MAIDDMPNMDELERLADFIGSEAPYIYGDGIASRMTGKYLAQSSITVSGFIVPRADAAQTAEGGIPVLSFQDAERRGRKERLKVILTAGKMTSEALSALQRMGMEDIFVVSEWNTQAIIKKMSPRTAENFDLEVSLADHCNLNCQCCDHFSPIAEKQFIDHDGYVKDITRLAQLQQNIHSITLCGGEPLLNDNCIEYCKITREYFPDTNIVLFTNGLLLPKWSRTTDDKNIWLAAKKYDVQINLTHYPIPVNLAKITDQAKKYDIPIVFEQPSTKGAKLWILLDYGNLEAPEKRSVKHPLDVRASVEKYRFIRCYHFNKCITLRAGKISTCPVIPNAQWYNKKFGQHLEITENCSIDLHTAQSFEEITEFLTHRTSFCDYCAVHKRYAMPWKQSRKEADEWTLPRKEEKTMTITITDMNRCTGCAACANACPSHAITMRENATGYYHPVIDREKCTECGLCDRICPEITKGAFGNDARKCFAIQGKDDLRYVSSSGGAFSLIVEECFNRYKDKKIYVAGAAFDGSWNVRHILIDDLHDLDKLRRSKYVQSFVAEDFYRTIRDRLKEDAFVVFSGVPCQAAGLRSFLQKDYDNLLIVDLICAQCCSPKVYRKFLEDNYAGETITSINFRSKIRGWDAHTVITTDKRPKEVITPRFMHAYNLRLLMNTPCRSCQHHSLHRQGDVTIGDFWGIGKRIPHLDDRKGTSCVLTSTAKGEDIVLSLKARCKLHEELPMDEALKSNWVLYRDIPAHCDIDIFHKNIDRLGYNKTLNQVANHTFDVAVMGWFWTPNYGAILTNYALNETINSLGYNCRTIDFIPPPYREQEYLGAISEKFAKKHLRLTRRVNNYAELASLNAEFGTFVAGSDQLWRYFFRKWPWGHLFLNFVNSKNRKLSYATSFCLDHYDGPDNARRLRKLWLSRFDALSVREHDGVTILKKDFGMDGVQVMDPVFLINKSLYEKIISDSLQSDGKDIVAFYLLKPTEAKMHIVRSAAEHYNTIAIDIKRDLPVEDWLYYIKNCKMLVTDSFHGSCFAAIFNKNFIAVNIFNEPPSRFRTLFSITGMEDRFLFDASEFDRKRESLFRDIDWTEANARLQKEIARSRAWLKDALEKPRREPSENAELLNAMLADSEEKALNLGIRCWHIEESLKKAAEATGIQNYIKELLRKTISDIEAQMKKH